MVADPKVEDQTPRIPIRYGVFDKDGVPQSFWCDDVFEPQNDGSRHEKIPPEAIELPEADYQQLISNQPLARYIDSRVVVLDPPPSMDSSHDWGPTMGEVLQ